MDLQLSSSQVSLKEQAVVWIAQLTNKTIICYESTKPRTTRKSN